MDRKSFFKTAFAGLAGVAAIGKIASEKEPEVEVTDVRQHFKFIGNSKGWPAYVKDGFEVKFTVNGKDLVGVLNRKGKIY